MAAIALLWVILGLHGVNADEITAMALGFGISPEVFLRQIVTISTTLMAVETPFLLMALTAVVSGLACQHTMAAYKIGIVIWSYAFGFVTVIALFDFHPGIFFVRHLFCVRQLLEIHQGASQKRKYEK